MSALAMPERPRSAPRSTVTLPYREIHETHSAYVILLGDVVYKMKKPIETGFLDFRTVESRRRACEREYTLNTRFSPDSYIGIAELTDLRGGPAEPLLKMHRLPDSARLSTLAESGSDTLDNDLGSIAHQLASVHSRSRRTHEIDYAGSREALTRRWSANFSETRELAAGLLDEALLGEIETRTQQFLAGRAPLFEKRIAQNRIVDGHGDLLGDDIFCLPDGPRILDCLDFDDALRFVDGIDDAACLAMDLEYHGRADLARVFLASYQEAATDAAPTSLVHHYIAYRAFVRSKVACLRFRQGDSASRSIAVRHAELALDHSRKGTTTLTLVGGLPGTGKSTLAELLGTHTEAVVISSDVVRKRLAGLDPLSARPSDFGHGIYTSEMSSRTYDELMRQAHTYLTNGHSVVLDASWMNAAMRARAELLATVSFSDLLQVECAVPRQVSLNRIDARAHSASDATSGVYDTMAAHRSRWPDAISVDTRGTPQESLDIILSCMEPTGRNPIHESVSGTTW